MAGIRQRRVEADYIKIKDAFVLMGTGFESLDEKPNAQTSEKRYVNDASTTQMITGYKWAEEFSGDQIKSDEAIEFITSIGKELKTGEDAITEVIKVDLDKPASTDGSFYARKFKVSVQVDEFPNNDGDLGLSGSFLGIGDAEIGSFAIESKTFTKGFTAASV